MDARLTPRRTLGEASNRLAQRLLVVCENRLELLVIELQEERNRLLRAILFGLAAAAFGLLAGVALTALVVVALGEHSPSGTLLALSTLYATAAVVLYARLARGQRRAQVLPGTLDQLRKDRAAFENQSTLLHGLRAGLTLWLAARSPER